MSSHKVRRCAWAFTVAAALTLGASGCAPEPGELTEPDTVAGQGGKTVDPSEQESSWSAPDPEFEAELRQTILPAGFPNEQFPVPEQSKIYDAGESAAGWFVVFEAQNTREADALWEAIIVSAALTPRGDATPTPEGGRWQEFDGASLAVLALLVPQAETVLVSYELTPTS